MNLFHSISVTSPLRLPPEIYLSLNTPASNRKLISLTSSRLLRKSAHCQHSWQKDRSCLLPPALRSGGVSPCTCSSATSLKFSTLISPPSSSPANSLSDSCARMTRDGLQHVHPVLLHLACGENPPCSKKSSQIKGSAACCHGPPWTTTLRVTLPFTPVTGALRILPTDVRSFVYTRVTVTSFLGAA